MLLVLRGADAVRSRSRWRAFVDEPAPRLVIAGVGAEEAFVRAGQFLPAVGVKWLDALVVFAPAAFVFEPLLQIRVAGKSFGQRPGLIVEGGERGAEHGVQEPDPAACAAPSGVNGALVRRAAIWAPTRRGSR